ncbi:cytochrome P450 monooxygenase-like protein [Alternaria rosae]|uniref:cytochrome P450 monooxygenase-like protein n=1 Tax=Alternaria rosae TaxID=1187941 RepID=UPI001E8D8CE6|nr:cytochrome P450 monooxygenase-like protein [Alternaria rosae]KAH6875624.1 cytochrome P450 monooxygenase-like protein [Alternaria rosae]
MKLLTYVKITYTLQTAAIAALVFVLFTFAPKLKQQFQLAKIPALSKSKDARTGLLKSVKEIYIEGYKKFKDGVYYMATSDGEEAVVIPPSLMPELRALPDDFLSFPKAVVRIMAEEYTKFSLDLPVAAHIVKSDLTPALARLNAIIFSEVQAAMRQHLPPCDDWTEVCINSQLMKIIAQVSGRIFVGPALSQDPDYLDIRCTFTKVLGDAVTAVKRMRPWLRPFLASGLPEIKKLRAIEKRAAKHLEPIVRERIEAEKNDPNWQKPEDLMQWLLTRTSQQGHAVTVESAATLQLGLIFAAVHTTTLSATNIVYSLASTPEYIQPLREEIASAIADNGGEFTSRALQQMVKLDSYMKEAVRVNPPSMSSFNRRVLKDITLSNGQRIPKGVMLEVPSYAVYMDAANYPSPSTFNPFRHSNLRASGSSIDNARSQFVSANETNLSFGYGRHACPGRFFATNEIKLVLTRLILDYDIKMPLGRIERWEQLAVGRTMMPDPTKSIMLKRVAV